jgi:hypothetical protein
MRLTSILAIETLYRRYAGWIDRDDDQADILEMERHYQAVDAPRETHANRLILVQSGPTVGLIRDLMKRNDVNY